MPGITTDPPKIHASLNHNHNHPTNSLSRKENLFHIVAKNKVQEQNPSRRALIELTEKLAEEARNGTLKGLGGFAEYEEGYLFGLEGSYLENPATAVLPVERLKRRIMDQIDQED